MSEGMVCLRFLFVLLTGVVCSFCGNNFVFLGRHAWRCKHRITQAERPSAGVDEDANESVATDASRACLVKCCCGRLCKGNRGLKMHQRSCRVVLGLNDQLRADLNDAVLTDQESGDVGDPLMASGVPSPQPEDHCFPDIKKGINLPKSEEQWLTANEYFKSVLSLNPPITVQNLSSRVKLLNGTVYDYFSANFGQVAQGPEEGLIRKYEGKSKNDLKKFFKVLKQSANADIAEIKYVSRLLRDILRDNTSCQVNADLMNHDYSISKNFWGYVKKIFNKKDEILPSFSMNECFDYFARTLSSVNLTKVFNLPSWIPTLSDPGIPFNLEPPTYQQISNVIRKMKASGSPSPLDQLSIICFKQCPFLRTYLSEIIGTAWSTGSVPSEWK